jgi:pyruvate kinase
VYTERPDLETRTKIVATLGPASWAPDRLVELIGAGVDTFRINCSHSDHAGIRRQVARVRRAAAEAAKPVSILLDLQGPKIRTGPAEVPTELASGDILTVVMDDTYQANGKRVGTTYPEMVHDVKPDDRVLFADGALSGTVVEARPDASPGEVDIRIVDGGKLGSHKGINLPGVDMSVPSLTDKDRADVAVGLELGVDYVALSFVRKADDVRELRGLLVGMGRDRPIIAKIEKPEALDNLGEILEEAEGVMVARGDLGVEVDLETVPVHQKRIIHMAAARGRLIITATQMLDSMERNPRPTRAETTDVANAILDGTDAVMLSGETSVGAYPVRAVSTMDGIARSVEDSYLFRSRTIDELPPLGGLAGAACRAAAQALLERPTPLLVFSWSGATARYMAKLRPKGPIFAASPNHEVVDALALVWGVTPFHVASVNTIEELIEAGQKELLDRGLVRVGERLVVLGGNGPVQGSTCFVKFHLVEG